MSLPKFLAVKSIWWRRMHSAIRFGCHEILRPKGRLCRLANETRQTFLTCGSHLIDTHFLKNKIFGIFSTIDMLQVRWMRNIEIIGEAAEESRRTQRSIRKSPGEIIAQRIC